MKNVVSLDKNNFSIACQLLGKKIIESDWIPDLIIGLANGGVAVANEVEKTFPEKVIRTDILIQRKTTRVKSGINFTKLARWLPYSITDFLRIIEDFLRRIFFIKKNASRVVELGPEFYDLTVKARKILLIDDAIDSGVSIKHAFNIIRRINGFSEIRTAVIVVTWPNPLVKPDYKIYENLLVRFPWSNDAKK